MIRLLCLEDVEEDALLIRKQLESEGLELQFDHVTSAEDYTSRISSGNYDLILSDYYLPGLNGIAALLIAKKFSPGIPFICVSGTIGEDMAVELMRLGAADYILKDRLFKLPVAVEHALREARVERARKEAEEELKASKEKFQRLVEDINDVVYEIDSDGIITYISPTIKSITGLPDSYYTGNPLLKFIYEEDLENAKERLSDLIFKGDPAPAEFRISKIDGEAVWLRTSSRQIITEEKPAGIRGIAVDITARKLGEEEIIRMKDSLEMLNRKLNDIRENERASISREIHDQLGQALTAIKIDASWLRARISRESSEWTRIDAILGLITGMIKDVQRISYELRPALLDDIGMVPAMESYLADFEMRTGIKCNSNLNDIQFPDKGKNLVMYRILQEALTNVVRHSAAKNVDINLFESDNSIVLEVIDNGRGLTNEKIVSYKSLGFLGIRERLKQHNGRLDIISSVGNGTCLRVDMPLRT